MMDVITYPLKFNYEYVATNIICNDSDISHPAGT